MARTIYSNRSITACLLNDCSIAIYVDGKDVAIVDPNLTIDEMRTEIAQACRTRAAKLTIIATRISNAKLIDKANQQTNDCLDAAAEIWHKGLAPMLRKYCNLSAINSSIGWKILGYLK